MLWLNMAQSMLSGNIRYANDNSNATILVQMLQKALIDATILSKNSKKWFFGLAYQEDQEALATKKKPPAQKQRLKCFWKRQEEDRIEKEKSLLAKAQEFIQKLDPDEQREVEAAAILSLPPEMQKMALGKSHYSKNCN